MNSHRPKHRAHWYAPRARALGDLRPLSIPVRRQVWQEVAKCGEWHGHAAGSFELTTDVLDGFIATFAAQKNPIPFTYEHPDYAPDGSPIKAAGWVHKLERRGDSLWALVTWTEAAAAMIKSGEYQFCSIVFSPEAADRATGETRPELFEIGMVNRPFIDGLQPLAASRVASTARRERKLSMKFDMKKIIEAMGELPKDASAEQLHKALEAAILAQEAMEKPAAEEPAPEAPEAEDPAEMSQPAKLGAVEVAAADPTPADTVPEDKAADAASQVLGALEKALGMDAAGVLAFVTENADKLAALAGEQPQSGTPADQAAMSDVRLSAAVARAEAVESKLAALEAELATFRAEAEKAAAAELEASVDGAIKAGHILPAHRETFVKLGRLNRAELDAELVRLSRAPQVPQGRVVARQPAGATGAGIVANDEGEAAIIRQLTGSPASTVKRALDNYRAAASAKLNGRA